MTGLEAALEADAPYPPKGKKFNLVGWVGHGSTGPGLIVSQAGGAANFAQFAFGLARSAGVVSPRFVVLIG